MTEATTRGAELAGRLDLAPEVRLVPAAFHETYGYGATGVWRAPGSVTLLSDGDASLSMAARWGTIVATHPREDDAVELALMNRPAELVRVTLDGVRPGGCEPWAAGGLSAVWALREAGHTLGGTTMLCGVDLPDGVGLAAPAATACAVALALRDMYAPSLPVGALPALVDRGLRAFGLSGERETGRVRAALLGRVRRALLSDGPVKTLVPLDVEAAGLRLVVVDTRIRREPATPVAERTPLREVAASLHDGDPAALGTALNAAHARLNGAGVPCREQNTVVASALGAGALGGRMIWDGPGRPVLLLLRAEDLAPIRTAVTDACVSRGLASPRFLTVTPFGPAAGK
jgi:galactokinase